MSKIQVADFVLNVQHAYDSLDVTGLRAILSKLTAGGFGVQARAGSDPKSSILLFVQLSAKAWEDLAKKDAVKSYEFGVTAKNDTPADRPRIVYDYLSTPEELGGIGITPGKGHWKIVTGITPVSGYLSDPAAHKKAVAALKSAAHSTLGLYKSYGSEVALYFEFFKFYLLGLAILSVFGVVAFFRSKNYSLTYSFVSLIWGTLFLLFWRRRELYLVNFWGVQNSHNVDKYNAELVTVNKGLNKGVQKEKSRKDGIRFVKQLAFVPVALAFVAVLVSYQLGCFVVEIFLSEIYDGPGKSVLTLLPTILISVFVPILTIVYNIFVDIFLSWESHESKYTRNDSSVVKSFVLNFLTGYVPLLITSFIYLPFAHLIEPNLPVIQGAIANNINSSRYVYKYLTKVKSQKEFVINQERLNQQFFFFIVTQQVVQLVLKYALPLVLTPTINFILVKTGKKTAEVAQEDESEQEWLDLVRKTVDKPELNVNDDFRGLSLQYGYLIMFGPVWTLAPLASLVFDTITFKLDQFKVASGLYFRPPVPKRVDSIHPWNHALFLLTWIGSIVSPIVTAFYRHGTKPPKPLGQFALDKASINVSSRTVLLLALFASEHIFIILSVVGLRVSNLLKSKVEIDNDFIDNDIQLRRDNFPGSSFAEESSAPDWESSIDLTLSQLKGIKLTSATNIKDSAKLSWSKSPAALSGEEKDTLLKQRRKELKEKEAELRRRAGKGESVITTVDSEGKETPALIDNNDHISESDSKEIEKSLDDSDQRHEKTNAALESSSNVEEESETSGKSGKKKGLKKLLKRK